MDIVLIRLLSCIVVKCIVCCVFDRVGIESIYCGVYVLCYLVVIVMLCNGVSFVGVGVVLCYCFLLMMVLYVKVDIGLLLEIV